MQRRIHRIGGPSSNNGSSGLPTSLLRGANRPYDGKIAGLYDLEETLGRGHFAVVKLARHVFTGEKVAVKVIDKSKLDEVSRAHLFQEVRCMKLVQHPNVVRLYEVIDTATKLYLILELGDGGDLYDYIIRHEQGLPEEKAKDYFRQIVRAISYCHQLHVVHRDLKPENVVFFKKLGVVKLTDFGFSNKFYPGQKLETSCGSLAYSAPEILLGDSYDAPAVDVWSLGVILYMLVCGQAPFQEANDSETLTMIMDCKYNVPAHVSQECRDLISRMLVRNPEKRAPLKEISTHEWLKSDHEDVSATDNLTLPLVSREQLSEEDHNFIVQKIVNGNIATKEEIQDCLDRNEYNHITATYYLLAERKLRSKRADVALKKRPENLAVSKNSLGPPKRENGAGQTTNSTLLSVPRTPGDLPQRSRKCSIVQEDEEEEDMSSCSGREELGPPLNRRGSRSEGRLSLALQERLAENERRKPAERIPETVHDLPPTPKSTVRKEWQSQKSSSVCEPAKESEIIPTTIITDSSTITIPIITTSLPVDCSNMPKYKTMPSPTTTTTTTSTGATNQLQLNEIFEEGTDTTTSLPDSVRHSQQGGPRFVKRTPYEQRRSKYHKARTASCSSSDASDDDSEKRKKRAHKLNPAPSKPFQGRRDSYDDSSDSQEPGTGAGTGGDNTSQALGGATATISTTGSGGGGGGGGGQNDKGGGTNHDQGGRKNTNCAGSMLGRRHKASRRRSGETRLRESQSLNRITEVQEDNTHALVISTVVVSTHGPLTPKVKGLGARILQGLSISTKKQPKEGEEEEKPIEKSDSQKSSSHHVSRKDTIKSGQDCTDGQDSKIAQSDKKKLKILGRYFQVHKKLCIPLPDIFNKNARLYKAQSCGSLVRDKINKTEPILRCRQRAVSVFRNSLGIEENNKNKSQNNKNEQQQQRRKSATVVQLNNVCNELTGMCAIHLEQTAKCSFC
ncbi:SNF-related serine/threonine-protein kinase [Anthonomus grandis grandis]|uniref:SNF-related serine/threonine-protein kinase n=1 Tax=Anthonomus grandis grandis TaxID=2921223 RepID=UPI0021659EBD|nr:SNF-related serine/threonine-protein kinase [Anthonomus grandis grandis]